MKPQILAILAMAIICSAAHAKSNKVLVHNKTTTVEIKLNTNTVVCSPVDYRRPMLKILIPQLANLTLLDHRNEGAGAPCVAAAECQPGHSPADILTPGSPEVESVPVHVGVFRWTEVDPESGQCHVVLVEEVHLIVRGIPFYHKRQTGLGTRHPEDCMDAVL